MNVVCLLYVPAHSRSLTLRGILSIIQPLMAISAHIHGSLALAEPIPKRPQQRFLVLGGVFPEKRYLIETASLQVRDSFCRRQSLQQTSSILKIAYLKLQKQTDTTVCVTMFNMDKVAVLAVLCELDLDFKNLLLHTKTLLND